MTPDMVFTLHQAALDGNERAVDLSAIRRSDAIIDLLASRRLMRPRAMHDPAITALSALTADVDTRGVPASATRAGGAARAGESAPEQAGPGRAGGQAVPADAWVRAAAAVAVAATVAGAAATTGVMVTAMLARIARMTTSQPGRTPGAGRAPARRAGSVRARRGR